MAEALVAAALADLSLPAENKPQIEWSDEYFKTRFMEYNKLTGRLHLLQAREYAKAFLNWYVSGKGAGKLLDLWIGVVSAMLTPTKTISHERLLLDAMFRGKSGEKEAIQLDSMDTVSRLTDFKYVNEGAEFSTIEAKTWYYRIFDMLESANTQLGDNNAITATTITAINYLGYIAMTLLKVLIKDGSKVSHHITKNVTNEFNSFWHTSANLKTRTPPPHKFAMNQFRDGFQKLTPKCIKALTLILATYTYTDSMHRETVRKILCTACLDYLDLYGMGCIYWLEKAQEACSTTSKKLMDYMADSRNKETNCALRNVLENFAPPTKNQVTWRWARLFVDQTFTEISITKNPQYAAVMAALTCKCDERNPVWNITQFRNETIKNNAIRNARAIFNHLDGTNRH